MRSLKNVVTTVLIIFILVLMFSVLINNLYTKPIFNLWEDIDNNSREVVDVYHDAEISMRVIKDVLVQLNSKDPITEERYKRISNSYEENYKKLKYDLEKMYNINKENIELIENYKKQI